ncbi:hypothetical protein [Bartonella sp. CB175]
MQIKLSPEDIVELVAELSEKLQELAQSVNQWKTLKGTTLSLVK